MPGAPGVPWPRICSGTTISATALWSLAGNLSCGLRQMPDKADVFINPTLEASWCAKNRSDCQKRFMPVSCDPRQLVLIFIVANPDTFPGGLGGTHNAIAQDQTDTERGEGVCQEPVQSSGNHSTADNDHAGAGHHFRALKKRGLILQDDDPYLAIIGMCHYTAHSITSVNLDGNPRELFPSQFCQDGQNEGSKRSADQHRLPQW